jgi:glycerol-3-phosphate dehydrogenase
VSNEREPYDIIVVGGGITGAGIARDAVLRGLRVALFEKGDFGSGTSSKSSKLIHGGLRYLEHYAFGMVMESVSERLVQRKVAPHLVRPLPFLMPVYEQNKPGLELMNIGLWLYDTMAMFRSYKLHKTFRGDKAREIVPYLNQEGLTGAIEYYDCVTDDARLVLENIIGAREQGADCRSYTEVVRFERDEADRVTAVVARDLLTGTEESFPTRAVIVAAGAWTDEFNSQLGVDTERPLLRRTKGVHIVFPHEKLPIRRAIAIISPVDHRAMFALPWSHRVVIGTTDTDFEGTADEVHADAEDVQYLCDSANGYFPDADFKPEDVLGTWAGLRPLIAEEGVEDESDVSREHEVYVRDDGITIIAGGKLTTYRTMAKEVVRATVGWLKDNDESFDVSLRRPRTKRRPLPGGEGMKEQSIKGVKQLARTIADEHLVDFDAAFHLTKVYGVRAVKLAEMIDEDESLGERMNDDLPYVWAEVHFAARHDLARSVSDVLARRIPLLLVGRNQGLDCADRVADILAEELGWTPEHRTKRLDAYRKTVADSRRFRSA